MSPSIRRRINVKLWGIHDDKQEFLDFLYINASKRCILIVRQHTYEAEAWLMGAGVSLVAGGCVGSDWGVFLWEKSRGMWCVVFYLCYG